jgi:hypothetical protein
MLQHAAHDAFAGGDVACQADDVFTGPVAHKDSLKDAVPLFYLKNPANCLSRQRLDARRFRDL